MTREQPTTDGSPATAESSTASDSRSTAESLATGESLATSQYSLADPSVMYPLKPPLTRGCPETTVDGSPAPLAIDYDYDAVDPDLFEAPLAAGAERWVPLLPPLSAPGLGEGNTRLVDLPELVDDLGIADRLGPGSGDGTVYIKDESANPTWSQKDRLARTAVSGAVTTGAQGVVVSSSGNHGAAAAAYAARAGLDAVVLTSAQTPGAVKRFCQAYGAAVIAVDDDAARRDAVDRLAEQGFHPVSSRTEVHTGHPYGPEGYKPIAYELYQQLDGRVPGSIFVPTCFGELLYGIWKGFRELSELGVTDRTPQMYACEPGVRAPLAEALGSNRRIASVNAQQTEAYSIKATTSSYRSVLAVEESNGDAIPFEESTLATAGEALAHRGLWQEDSGAAGVAGLVEAVSDGLDPQSPIVCIATSSGFKNGRSVEVPQPDPEWNAIAACLRGGYGIEFPLSED